jgi:hypothetical protein
MLKRSRLPILALGTTFTLLSPMGAFARHQHREHVWREDAPIRHQLGHAYGLLQPLGAILKSLPMNW